MPSRDLKVTLIGENRLGPAFSQAGEDAGQFHRRAKLAFAAAGVAVGAFVKSAVTAGADFDATLRQMAAVAGVPQKDLKTLSSLALKMGADTKYSAQQAADAMLELAKGGMTAAQIKGGVLKETLTLAAAGGLDLAAAGTTMSNALNTFGLSAGQAGQVAAALAGGANASTASVESLGQALSQVGPGAKNAGLSLQETVAALAAFDNAGIKGSDAGTSLKTMLTRLVPTTTAAAKEMRRLGLDFTDAQGSFLPLADISEQLKQKLSGLSQEQRTTALATIFGADATRAASVLMNEGAAGIVKYTKATSDQAAAQKVADATMQGVRGALEQLSGSWDTLKTQAGLALAPMVEGIAKFGTTALNAVPSVIAALAPVAQAVARPFVEGLRQAQQTFTQFAAPLATAIRAVFQSGFDSVDVGSLVGKLSEAFGNALQLIGKLAGKMTIAIGTLIEKVNWASLAVQIGKQAPAVLIGLVIGLLNFDFGSAIRVLKDHWFEALLGVLTVAFAPARVIGKVGEVLAKIPFVGKLLEWALEHFAGFARGIVEPIASVFRSMGRGFLEGIGLAGKGLISGLVDAAQFFIFRLRFYGTVWAQAGLDALKGLAGSLGRGIGFAFRELGKGMADAARGFTQSMAELLLAAGKAVVTGFIRGITSAFGAVKQTLGKLTSMLPDWKGPASVDSVILFTSGVQIIDGFIAGLQSRYGAVKASLSDLTDSLPSSVSAVDFSGARDRANMTGVGKAEVARDEAARAVPALKAAAAATGALAAKAQTAAAAAERHRTALFNATQAAVDHARALHRAAQAAAARAADMPARTARERAAKEAVSDHAAALLSQARSADDAVVALRRQLAAAQQAASASAAAAKAAGETAGNASRSFLDAQAALVKAQAELADAVYADQLSKAQAFATDVTARLDALVERADALKSAFASGVTAGTGLADLFKGEAEGSVTSFESVLNRLTGRLDEAKSFSAQIGDLAGAGLADGLLTQIAAAGPKVGSQMAEAILGAGPEGIASLNELFTQIQQVATTGVDAVAASLYAPGALALKNYVAGLRSVFPELDGVMQAVAAKVGSILGLVTSARSAASEPIAVTTGPVDGTDNAALLAEVQMLRAEFARQNDRYVTLARSGAM